MMKLKRSVAVALSLLLALLCGLTGCAQNGGLLEIAPQGSGILEEAETVELQLSPRTRADGSKFRIGMVDIDEYEPASIYFYYLLEGLKNKGWLEYDSLPFSATSFDVKKMMQLLAGRDLGPYIEFVDTATHYLSYENEDDIAANLRAHIASEEGLDLILAMGTDPGLFCKPLNLGIPILVCMATDPVESGIIISSKESGDPNIWAQVEPLPYYRQIKFYHNMYAFKNIGMVYSDPVVAGISGYEAGANELRVEITKVLIEDQTVQTDAEIEAFTQQMLAIYQDLIHREGIDAFMLNADVIGSNVPLDVLLAPFYEASIPVFVQDGENYVRDGALLLVASTDNKGVGQFVAEVIAQVFNGANAGDVPCEYVSSPYMSINLDVAKRIGYRPSFEMLLSCETIYTENNK